VTCHDARELFSARIDDALGDEERAGLDAHLASCPECRRERGRFEATVGLLRGAAPVRAPAGFVDRVLAARPAPWHRRLGRRLFWPLPVKLPLEAAALVLVAVGAAYLYERAPGPASLARQETAVRLQSQESADQPAAPAPSTLGEKAAPAAPPRDARLADAPAASGAAPKREAPPASPPAERKEAAPPPAAPAPPVASAPRAAAESEVAREGERRDAAAPPAPGAAGAERQRLAAASKAMATAEVSGRLTVPDRPGLDRALAALLARVGAAEVGRQRDGDALVVEIVVPGPAYPELAAGLAHLGRWEPERAPAEPLPASVRARVRIAD
jgi:hypothetical protein